MEVNTGQIYEALSEEELKKKNKDGSDKYFSFMENLMTLNQKEAMQVSKFDNRSELGKKFTESRQVRRRKQRESIKNKVKR